MSATLDVPSVVTRILDQVGIRPRGVQKEAIEKGLLGGESILVCSPTGSGKTLVGEIALLRAISSGQRGLYMTPLRALAEQVYTVLQERYSSQNISIGVSTSDYQLDGSELEDYDILVTTFERADSLLRHKAQWLEDIGTVVVDEIQSIGESSRGARLESVIMRLKHLLKEFQVIALSATIGFPDQLAEWLGCKLVQSSDRPVPLLCSVVVKPSRDEAVLKYAMTTVQRDGQVLVFHRTRRDAEAEARRLSSHVGKQLTSEEQAYLQSELNSLEHCDAALPKNLIALLHDGTAYHHAGLSLPARRMVEALFRIGKIRVICATTTLSSGMNLPARTVVIANTRSPADYRQIIEPNQIHQMLGRAGRPGLDTKGFGIVIADSRGQADEIKERAFDIFRDEPTGNEMLTPKYEPLSSVLGHAEFLDEQLLVALDMYGEARLDDIEQEYFGESFLMHQAVRDSHSPMRPFYLSEIDAGAAIERHALSDTVRAARTGVLGSVRVRETNESVIGGLVHQRIGDSATCRFSSRSDSSGIIEGPMCSCGRPIDRSGILCPHLVALGISASKEYGQLCDYVIPLSLGESSPSGVLIRLGLAEGGESGRIRISRLGRLVSRLYLRIPTAREALAVAPLVTDTKQLISLLRHLVSIESSQALDETFEHVIYVAVSTRTSTVDMAEQFALPVGDLVALLDRSRWLLYAIAAIAKEGNLSYVSEQAQKMWEEIDSRFSGGVYGSN
jgi:superfamily II DNA/RNA helicase